MREVGERYGTDAALGQARAELALGDTAGPRGGRDGVAVTDLSSSPRLGRFGHGTPLAGRAPADVPPAWPCVYAGNGTGDGDLCGGTAEWAGLAAAVVRGAFLVADGGSRCGGAGRALLPWSWFTPPRHEVARMRVSCAHST